MDFSIDTATGRGEMTFEQATDIMNNIYLSLTVQRGSFFARPGFGSRLHLLRREKNTDQAAALAKDYCREALQWLIDCGRAREIAVDVERDPDEDPHRLKVRIQVTQADLSPVTFETYQEVV
ncbi:MAG: phage GP46 family protein [Deltaproteobacteria bacterium]|nr:phage GP46 family protein [Deltaproteobacteria bacterium]